jgi:hypothetical protein
MRDGHDVGPDVDPDAEDGLDRQGRRVTPEYAERAGWGGVAARSSGPSGARRGRAAFAAGVVPGAGAGLRDRTGGVGAVPAGRRLSRSARVESIVE